MLTNILIIVFLIMIGASTYYQIKSQNKERELNVLKMSNEVKRGELLDIKIVESRIQLEYVKKQISKKGINK